MNKPITVRFEPQGISAPAHEGDNLLEIARSVGVGIAASCGGDGVCGTCRVSIKKGDVETSPGSILCNEDVANGVRLACQTRILTDLIVYVLPEAQAPASSGHLRSLVTREEVMAASGWRFAPPVFKLFIALPPPNLRDNSSDLTRLARALESHGIENPSIALAFLKKLPGAVRECNWKITLTALKEQHGLRLIDVEGGDTRDRNYGIAFDIGTTGIRGELLDLNEGKVLAQGVEYNGQRAYGDDVISRINYSGKRDGLTQLQRAVVSTMNKIASDMASRASVNTSQIAHVMVAANTTMVQLMTGVEPKYLRLEPYVPTASVFPVVSAGEIGLDLGYDVPVSTIPSVASYIGGDIVSGLVGTGIFQRSDTVLYIDIGTNGEIVVGNREWMVSASCSAGPAFEGGGIRHGMLATAGAIESFRIGADGSPNITTIGGDKPRGICGAGLISAISALYLNGIINQRGKFNIEASKHVRDGEDGPEYLLVQAGETSIGKDIVLTEIDVENLIRAKGAMYAGYQTLLASVDLTFDGLVNVIVAGTFGSHLDIEDAITIGLLPDIDRGKFVFVGNGSLLGARLSSFSTELIEAGRKVAGLITNIELSENVSFMENYTASMFLPHTDASLFPSVSHGVIKSGGTQST
ncbi:putative 2Fe-2 cluster-containing protein [Dehalogenimonas formicexedens]|uniref:Putative 2Fe-2 cluster-containing protein n=1 Tax=Dehalogenimonas formicexedens TaxID=1839801 RepID=A0A1P8F6Z2_9CHLR|nr:ASKHA domain-containing protein [Dehalogenimonas formicexedens]APV44225.1 putative 2Fe-2 cluster-containing protein [Dehalogenimonas formicexedens]APV44251.1 putative 2Fe-2 cluster-containing protein [Dehalogenimonas formicexedens]